MATKNRVRQNVSPCNDPARHSRLTAMQIQRLRRFTLHVLLAWVLVLATGVANACVITMHLPIGGDTHQTMRDEADCHDHASNDTKPPCERCCDEPSALPQQAVKHGDPSGLFPAALPAPSFTHFAAGLAARLDSHQLRWRATVPIPIAFLRLAL